MKDSDKREKVNREDVARIRKTAKDFAQQAEKSGVSLPKWAYAAMAAGAVAALLLAAATLYFFTDILLLPPPAEPETVFTAFGEKFTRVDETAEDTEFLILGVGLSQYAIDGADEAGLVSLFADIAGTNANTVRVADVQEPLFYRALAEYNREAADPLYLLQGVALPEETYAAMEDAETGGLANLLIRRGRLALDAIHGTRRGVKRYTADVSEYVVGISVGQDWDGELVLYTNHVHSGVPSYKGRYISAWSGAPPFTSLLAEVLDDLYRYQTGKFRFQTPIGIENGMNTDLLPHDFSWSQNNYEVIAAVDTLQIEVEPAADAGYFIGAHAVTGSMKYLSFDPYYSEYIDEDGNANPFRGYLAQLNTALPFPVVLTETSVSSARGVSGLDEVSGRNRGGMDETEQAGELARVVDDALAAGSAGICVDSLLDDPTQHAWNTGGRPGSIWKNVMDTEQSTGLIALDPDGPCLLDGDFSEWEGVSPLAERDGITLKALYDRSYLYLQMGAAGYAPETDTMLVAFDITPASGSETYTGGAEFAFPADLVLAVQGEQRSRLYVHEYYDPVLFENGPEVYDADTRSKTPLADSDVFSHILQYCREPFTSQDQQNAVEAATNVAGVLRHGSADPASDDYDSLADFCFGENGVEVRLPWALLGVTDPVLMEAAPDRYQTPNQTTPLTGIGMELVYARGGGVLQTGMGELPLSGGEARFTTRKKAAYDALAAAYGPRS